MKFGPYQLVTIDRKTHIKDGNETIMNDDMIWCANLSSDIVVKEEVCVGVDSVLQPPQPVRHLLSLPVQHVHVRHLQYQDQTVPLQLCHKVEFSLPA